MSFAHPYWLFGLLALPLVALWMGWAASARRRRLARYAREAFWASMAGNVSWRKKRYKYALRLSALAFLLIAAARPQWGVKERPLVREGSDLFICLDVSTSMLAQDIAPTRLASAKQQIRSLIYNLKGDRVGLVLFAGDAFVQCPLTLDYGLAVDLLDAASPQSVSVQGTRIGVAINTARKAFDRSAQGTKSIILVTDGEDQGSDPVAAAKEAAKDGIVIECVGIGTTEGVPILLPNHQYKKDAQGRTVTSRLDVATLRKIALATGGKAVVTDSSGNMDLDTLYNEIEHFQKHKIESTEASLLVDRYQWPLSVGVLLLAVELFLGDRVKEKNGRRRRLPFRRSSGAGKAAGAALAASLLVFVPHPVQAAGWEFGNRAARLCEEGNRALENGDAETALSRYHDAKVLEPDNPVLDYNIGVALARQKKWEAAQSAFEEAARKAHDSHDLRSKALYNSAISDVQTAQGLAKQKELDKAIQQAGRSIDSNRKALDIQPGFGDAKQNLEESRQLLQQLIHMKKMAQQKTQGNQERNKKSKKDQKNNKQKQKEGENQKSQNKKSEGKKQEQKNGKQGKENQQGQGGQAAPTPTPTLTPKASQEKEEKAKKAEEQKGKKGKGGNAQQAKEAAEIGKMTKEDAIRLLSTLPNENPHALQKSLQAQQGSVRLERDW